MSKLIARVRVTTFVGDKRTDFEPGDELPDDLPAHDVEALKRMNAVEDVDAAVADEALAKRMLDRARADYEEARRRVQAAQASIAPGAGNTESNVSGSTEPESAAGGAIPGTNTSESVASEVSGASPDAGGQGGEPPAPPAADADPKAKSRGSKPAAAE